VLKEKGRIVSDRHAYSKEVVPDIGVREVAHDINNMLSVAIGSIELSKGFMDNPEKMREYLDHAISTTARVRELLVKEFLSKEKAPDDEHPVDVAPIVRDVEKMLRSTLPENIVIQCSLIEDMKVMVPAMRLSRVLINLCINAISAMGQGGGILRIAMSKTIVSDGVVCKESIIPCGMPAGEYVQISVSDTGCGIPPEIMDQIFKTSFTTKKQGNGLGLTVVDKVVRGAKGWISCESKDGEGTTFNIYLPKYIPNHDLSWNSNQGGVKPPAKVIRVNWNTPKKILFADDEHSILDLADIVLKDQGYTVVVADDGRKAFDIFQNNPDEFAVAVLDVAMPEMDGDELVQHILDIRPDLPVIMCTGYCDISMREKLCRLGVKKLVMKPYLMKELLKDIQELLEK
jgi:nitrogen-specific signal transduction histidine kinase/CheY-like chemotaxis protein